VDLHPQPDVQLSCKVQYQCCLVIEERCNCLKSVSSCELCVVDSYCHRTAEVFSPCDGAFKKCKVIINVQVCTFPQWCN